MDNPSSCMKLLYNFIRLYSIKARNWETEPSSCYEAWSADLSSSSKSISCKSSFPTSSWCSARLPFFLQAACQLHVVWLRQTYDTVLNKSFAFFSVHLGDFSFSTFQVDSWWAYLNEWARNIYDGQICDRWMLEVIPWASNIIADLTADIFSSLPLHKCIFYLERIILDMGSIIEWKRTAVTTRIMIESGILPKDTILLYARMSAFPFPNHWERIISAIIECPKGSAFVTPRFCS